jgi:chaperonin GroEL
MIREAAERTGDEVGDGTSTSTILAQTIFAEGVRNVAAGASGIDLKRGLDRGLRVVVEALRNISRPVGNRKERAQVATISAHNDISIGELVADAVEKVGQEGVISVEEAKGTETTLEVVEGLQFDRGFLSPYFITDPEKLEAVLVDPLIMLYDKRINSLKVISEELGLKLENVTVDALGKAKRVVSDREKTTIIGGAGSKEAIETRCNDIRKQIKLATSDYDREKLEDRLAKLAGGVAVIRVGAPSETEMKSRKEAFDDAINAAKAASSEGIVPGGGLALLRTIPALEAEADKCEGDERTGIFILRRALEAPTRQIAENSSVDGGVVVDKMRNATGNYGFDAARGEYVDLIEAGIIDPTKVIRIALENAVSAASVLLLTEATLTEIPEKQSERSALDQVGA